MTPQQMINAAQQVQQRWPEATIRGFYGNMAVRLDVVIGGKVVTEVDCLDGSLHELPEPVTRGFVRWTSV